jgi:DNA gyrase/topoisomerase IV subunit A
VADAETLYEKYFLEYASYVIKNRAIPEIDDGLKPVQRRILHTLFELDDGKYHKVANIVGQTMRFHPHGDQSIFGALVTLANKDLFIDKQGNFGSILTGDRASAARYIECRLTPLAREILLSPAITNYVASYDGRNQEPVAFPAKIPVVLVLGAEGIAVGMSTRILPHNPIEVIQAQIACLKGEGFQLFPDFPTGGLVDLSAYDDGHGKVLTRARLEARDPSAIIVRELPFGTTTDSLIASIEDAIRKKKIKISKIDDYTADEVEIEIKTSRQAEAEDIIKGLYAFTACESAMDTSLLIIKDGHPCRVTVTDLIHHSAKQLQDILRAELDLEAQALRIRLRAKQLEQIFIESRVYKDIEEITEIDLVYEAVRRGVKDAAISPVIENLDAELRALSQSSADVLSAVRSLITTIHRSLTYAEYGPSRDMVARNLDTIRTASPQEQRTIRALLNAVKRDLSQEQLVVGEDHAMEPEDLTTEDIDRLLNTPIYRISRYDIDQARTEMTDIKDRLQTVRHHLHHLTSYAIDFLERLVADYRQDYPRRTEVTSFTPMDVREAAARDLILRYDTETGYMGYAIKRGEPLFNISLYDRVVIVRAGGIVGVHNVLDKLYVDLDILYCKMENPDQVFTVIYRDAEDCPCIKRFRLDRCQVNQLYELVPADCTLLEFIWEADPTIVLGYQTEADDGLQEETIGAEDYEVKSHRGRGERMLEAVVEQIDVLVDVAEEIET